MVHAQELANNRQFADALIVVDGAREALPNNAASQDLKNRLFLLRQQIVSYRDSGVGGEVPEVITEAIIKSQIVANNRSARQALDLADEARKKIRLNQLDEAQRDLDQAFKLMPANVAFEDKRKELRNVQAELWRIRMEHAVQAIELESAEHYLSEYKRNTGETKRYLQLKEWLDAIKQDPRYRSIKVLSPEFAEREVKAKDLLVKARAQYLYGDYASALLTFKEVNLHQPYNTEAKGYIIKINEALAHSSALDHEVTKKDLLEITARGWRMPDRYIQDMGEPPAVPTEDPILVRMKQTIIPAITLRDRPLRVAIETLSEMSVDYDPAQKGFNMVTIDPENKNPTVSIVMRNTSFDRILEYVVKPAGFNYTLNGGIIEVRPDIGTGETDTEFFPVNATAVTRMTGIGGATAAPAGGGGGGPGFAAGPGGGPAVGGAEGTPQELAIRAFLQRSGVPFDGVAGAALSYDGAKLIITQNRRNLEKIKNILRRYSSIKQVHVQTKFIDVSEGVLKQLATNFSINRTNPATGLLETKASTNLRTLTDAHGRQRATSAGGSVITNQSLIDPATGMGTFMEPYVSDIPNNPPLFPQAETGPADPTFSGILTSIGNWDLQLIVHAIEATEGSDLLAIPSVTVLDQKPATIKIVQELIYPQSYAAPQMQQPQSYNNNNGYGGGGASSASGGFTAGSPQDFTMREVGVILNFTPTVSEEDDTISLHLEPKVVEFEGFVEYGGVSVAIAGNTTVTAPSGNFMPIFSVREVNTDVTIYDGATVVLGGLTREEIKTVSDKVPVLGDIPLIGNLFRSKGRSSTKRNLMIFVTANLISPGGGTLKQSVGPVRPSSFFSDPTIIVPSGAVPRSFIEAKPLPTGLAPEAGAPVPALAPAP
jgi:general secretion pathway protein D